MSSWIMRKARFWIVGYKGEMGELFLRLRHWGVTHWWPSRIRQLETELGHYRRWLQECEAGRYEGLADDTML